MTGNREERKNKLDEEHNFIIPLENFGYSNTTSTENNNTESATRFLGRTKELARLKDHLIYGHKKKNFRGSILVAGYRGAGKTRFVNEALSRYQSRYKEECEKNYVEVKINLGSEKSINSKTVLFNMVALLMEELEDKIVFFRKLVPLLNSRFFQYFLFLAFLISLFFFFRETQRPLFCSIDCNFFVYPYLVVFFAASLFILIVFKLFYFRYLILLNEIQALQKEMYSTSEKNWQLGGRVWGGFGSRVITKPLDNNQIESRLRLILKKAAGYNFEIIFIFDELDKLSGVATDKSDDNHDFVKESQLRKQQVDSVLGDLKNLITSSNAIYIFIAGRDMYDAYLSERGSSNSLYESLFNDHIYIPSFMTDRSNNDIYYLDSIIEAFVVSNLISEVETNEILKKIKKDIEKKENADLKTKDLSIYLSFLKLLDYSKFKMQSEFFGVWKNEENFKAGLEFYLKNGKEPYRNVYILKTLIHFLTLHSWGNCKRLFTLFESFVRFNIVTNRHELFFSTKDIQRLVLASHLYIQFHHNLSRMLMNADDKLVVSSLSVFHYILKYHGIGFSRGHILRMYETINVHSSPELADIVDVIIHNVLRNHVRRIRNSFYRYRFSFLHEQEIHFITTINDGESAVFNFSLNAMDAVKQHYRNLITESQYAQTDRQYGDVAIASIHVVVGNFHFWEQSYDEAKIQFGIALDILDRNIGTKNELAQIDIAVQQVEVFLKQGSVAERMGNYSSAASIYISAEDIADKCLETLYSNGIKDLDSKWDVLRQPKWAKQFLNLKRSAIHYDQHNHLDRGNSDVSRYRNAVLSLFMENYSHAYSGFMTVTKPLIDGKGNERSSFLEGNAYLKAGFSLLLNNSNSLYKDFNKVCVDNQNIDPDVRLGIVLSYLVDSVDKAVKEVCEPKLKNLEDFEEAIIRDQVIGTSRNEIKMGQAIGLIKKSATCFSNGRLNANAATSYLSIVLMWEALLEMIPWYRIDNAHFKERMKKKQEDEKDKGFIKDSAFNDTLGKIENIKRLLKKVRENPSKNFIFTAQEESYKFNKINTTGAFSHFMKTALSGNLGVRISDTIFSEEEKFRDIILNNTFLKDYLYQHYSVFGQVMCSSVYWEEITHGIICSEVSKNSDPGNIGSLMQGAILPYGIRYYSTMLWLKGRVYLYKLQKYLFYEYWGGNKKTLSPKIKEVAANALINLFRSSQYVIKTNGETSNMVLPPLFIIYYNMWEVLFHLVSVYKTEDEANFSLVKVVAKVRDEMDEVFRNEGVKDVTARTLDLNNVTQIVSEQFKIVERMGDLNSRDRTSIIRNKYYLDDDYEDNMFNLDWCYCRFLAPGAMVHRLIIESEMRWLRKASEKTKNSTKNLKRKDNRRFLNLLYIEK